MANLLKKVMDYKNLPNDTTFITNVVNKIVAHTTFKTNVTNLAPSVPVGTIVKGYHALTGFLKCSGQAVSRTTYSALFAKLGTKFGAGDGSTTFNLPRLYARTGSSINCKVGQTTNGEWSASSIEVKYDSAHPEKGIRAVVSYQGSITFNIPENLRPCRLEVTLTRVSGNLPQRWVIHSSYQVTRNLEDYTWYYADGGSGTITNGSSATFSRDIQEGTASSYFGFWGNQSGRGSGSYSEKDANWNGNWDCWINIKLIHTETGIVYMLHGTGTKKITAGYDAWNHTENVLAQWVADSSVAFGHYIKY